MATLPVRICASRDTVYNADTNWCWHQTHIQTGTERQPRRGAAAGTHCAQSKHSKHSMVQHMSQFVAAQSGKRSAEIMSRHRAATVRQNKVAARSGNLAATVHRARLTHVPFRRGAERRSISNDGVAARSGDVAPKRVAARGGNLTATLR